MSPPVDKYLTPRICFVLPSLVTAGAELQTIEQINELVERRIEVSLVILSTTIEESLIGTLSLPPETHPAHKQPARGPSRRSVANATRFRQSC